MKKRVTLYIDAVIHDELKRRAGSQGMSSLVNRLLGLHLEIALDQPKSLVADSTEGALADEVADFLAEGRKKGYKI